MDIDDEAMVRLGVHAENMVVFNGKINLTTITDPYNIAIKHIVDSFAAVSLLQNTNNLLDIGTGAGYPGIPIKIAKPHLSVTLIDRVARKVSYLKHVIRHLAIEGLNAFHVRAEDGKQLLPGPFDAVVTRAVGPLLTCWELSRQWINCNSGTFIAMRGRVKPDELEALREIIQEQTRQSKYESSWELSLQPYRLPTNDEERSIVSLRFFTL